MPDLCETSGDSMSQIAGYELGFYSLIFASSAGFVAMPLKAI
jgi:hypothetical protein